MTDKPMNLGDLIDKLEAVIDKDIPIFFQFGHIAPGYFLSYRGSYEELALWVKERGAVSCEDFLSECKSTLGDTFEGYKGGEFLMTRETPIHIADYGEATNTVLLDVINKEYWVELVTGEIENGGIY